MVELRAPVAVDKGTAGVALARALGAGEAWPASVPVFTVRVGTPDVPTAAAYRLPDPDALRGVLEAVVAEQA